MSQARRSNPDARIILLGDQENKSANHIPEMDLEFWAIEDYSISATSFESVYKHTSSNTFDYEIFCFQRWFAVNELASKLEVNENLVYLDSDALLYMDADKVFEELKSEMTVCNEVGPAFTFFKSRRVLNDYCEFIYQSFSSQERYSELHKFVEAYKNHGMPHISDMATLGLYGKQNDLTDIGKIEERTYVFCENVGESQGLILGILGKKIYKIRQKRFFKVTSGESILAGGVHLQGWQKILWPFYADFEIIITFKREIIFNFFRYIKGFARGIKLRNSKFRLST